MCQEMREIQFRQHALATTQRTAGSRMQHDNSGGYPAPTTQLAQVPSGNQQLMRLPSGQVVMVTPVGTGFETLGPAGQKMVN